MKTVNVERRWFDPGHLCIVAASGPSLTPEVARQCEGFDVIAVSDAYRAVPKAKILFSTDVRWWKTHGGALSFKGEKWTTHDAGGNRKNGIAETYMLKCVRGADLPGFSANKELIHYGRNSGFAAVNLAILFGAEYIVLVGFDMQRVNGRSHFFGEHPKPLHNSRDNTYRSFIQRFEAAAKCLPSNVKIVNTVMDSALNCFPKCPLTQALNGELT